MSEAEVQKLIKEGLKTAGYTVMDTAVYGSPRIMRAAKQGGTTKGLPDLFVTHDSWPTGIFIGLEVKTEKGALKPEQQELLDRGRIAVVRSFEDAYRAVQDYEAELGRSV